MNRKFLYMMIAAAMIASGCSFFTPAKKTSSLSYPEINATGTVIKRTEFKKGGRLVILPFKAGANAEASAQLDRVALMIVKGMIDYLSQEKTPFTVLTTQDQGKPDLIIDGYIDEFVQPGTVKRWIMQNKKAALAVEGYMEVPGTNERIVVFQHKRFMPDPQKDGLNLAYKMGQDLGRFLVESLEQ